MAVKNVGTLIKEGRTAKKLSQEQVASQIDGLSASDIGKAERGEKALTATQLRAVAKIIGVTQKSLLEAPAGGTNGTKATSTAKTTAAKTSSAKTTAAKTTAAKKTTSSKTTTAAKTTTAKSTSAKTSAAKTTTEKTAVTAGNLTTTEKRFLELYREASSDSRKLATRVLKGEVEIGDLLPMLMSSGSGGDDGLLGALLGKLQGLKK